MIRRMARFATAGTCGMTSRHGFEMGIPTSGCWPSPVMIAPKRSATLDAKHIGLGIHQYINAWRLFFEDSRTHVFLFKNIGSVSFRRPFPVRCVWAWHSAFSKDAKIGHSYADAFRRYLDCKSYELSWRCWEDFVIYEQVKFVVRHVDNSRPVGFIGLSCLETVFEWSWRSSFMIQVRLSPDQAHC